MVILGLVLGAAPIARADEIPEDPGAGGTTLVAAAGYLLGSLAGSFLGCWAGSQVGDDQLGSDRCESGFIAGAVLGGGLGLAGSLTLVADDDGARFAWTWLGQAIGVLAAGALLLACGGTPDLAIAIPLAIVVPVGGGVLGFALSARE